MTKTKISMLRFDRISTENFAISWITAHSYCSCDDALQHTGIIRSCCQRLSLIFAWNCSFREAWHADVNVRSLVFLTEETFQNYCRFFRCVYEFHFWKCIIVFVFNYVCTSISFLCALCLIILWPTANKYKLVHEMQSQLFLRASWCFLRPFQSR